MDRETIIKLAQECLLIGMRPHLDGIYQESLERFAKLVAEHRDKWWEEQVKVEVHEAVLEEREACAKAADTEADEWGSNSDGCYASRNIADAIRARSR